MKREYLKLDRVKGALIELSKIHSVAYGEIAEIEDQDGNKMDGRVIKIDNDIKKIQSRIDTLAIRAAQGADEKIISEIRSLESGGRMSYELWICEI